MKELLKENNKQKHQFKSYYCAGCSQSKPCGLLTDWDSKWESYCCQCYFQSEKEKAEEYNSYELTYQQKVRERKEYDRQLLLLRDYQGCQDCKSKEVDAYFLYENSQLVCQPCQMKKEGGSSEPISFTEQQKWYKKWWRIDLTEWLENFSRLPVNAECAKKWLKDRNHLNNCDCLEKEVKELVELFSNSLKEYQEKLRECKCEKSEKIRVSSDYYAWCERCERSVMAASKKRVIKNRNDPRFWGIITRFKILCLKCLGKKFYKKLSGGKRKTFNKYRGRRYV